MEHWVYRTVIGTLAVSTESGKIVRLDLPGEFELSKLQTADCPAFDISCAGSPVCMNSGGRGFDESLACRIGQELSEFFAGARREFDLPFDMKTLPGTDFQKRVWNQLLQIPYGSTQTYGQIARNIGNPMASRAVGQAIHRNPISILIPCHRVVGGNGKPGGFRAGLALKRILLNLEAERQLNPFAFE